VLAFAFATVHCTAQAPDRTAALLEAQLGKWQAEGWMFNGVEGYRVKAIWECKRAVDRRRNVCTWQPQPEDRATTTVRQFSQYDPGLAGFLHTLEPAVDGKTMTGSWEFTDAGKTAVGINRVVIEAPGEWVQHTTVEAGGRRINEISVTHRRVK
jgi:hypothetical protein